MTPTLKIRLSALAFCLLLGTGCQKSPVLQKLSETNGPQLAQGQGQGGAMTDDGTCLGAGEEYLFSLKTAVENDAAGATIPEGMTYRTYLGATPAYLVGENCLCKLEYYTLEFDYLPAAALIQLEGLPGQTIPFSGPFPSQTGSGQYIEISKLYLQTNVFIGFDPSVTPLPRLGETGGLCIVDNISAPDGTTLQTVPHTETAFDGESRMEYTAIFLPVEGTEGMIQ